MLVPGILMILLRLCPNSYRGNYMNVVVLYVHTAHLKIVSIQRCFTHFSFAFPCHFLVLGGYSLLLVNRNVARMFK